MKKNILHPFKKEQVSLPFFFIWTVILTLYLVSCSSTKNIEQKPFNIHDVIENINKSGEKLKSLKGSGNISLENESGGNSGNFRATLLKPDSLYISITGPFGINIVKAFIERDTFLFHDAFNNVIVTGKTSKKNINEIFRVNIGFEDMMSIVSCVPDFSRENGIIPQINPNFNDNEAVIIYEKEGDIIKYYLNLENRYITKRIVYSGSGKITREEKYQSYYKFNDTWIPRSIQITLPIENQSLSLYFEKQEFNTKDLNFSVPIPKDTKVLHWRSE